jgi:predicted amidophosphoribosyltransferase
MAPVIMCEHCGEALAAHENTYCDLCADEMAAEYAAERVHEQYEDDTPDEPYPPTIGGDSDLWDER